MTNQTPRRITLRHHGDKVVGVETTDSARYSRGLGTKVQSARSTDSLLLPVLTGKVLALGEYWDGLRRATDYIVEALPFDSPFTPPHLLTPEPVLPGDELELGAVYSGAFEVERFANQVKDAGGELHATAKERAAAVAQWCENFRQVVQANTPHGQPEQPESPTTQTGDGDARSMIAKRRTTGDFSKASTPSDVNKRNADFWAKRNAPDLNDANATPQRNLHKP